MYQAHKAQFTMIVKGSLLSIHSRYSCILGDPRASSRDNAILILGESLLQELKSPWELILNEPVPEVVEFRPTDWAGQKNIFLPNQRGRLVG